MSRVRLSQWHRCRHGLTHSGSLTSLTVTGGDAVVTDHIGVVFILGGIQAGMTTYQCNYTVGINCQLLEWLHIHC